MRDEIRNLLRELPRMDDLLALPWTGEYERVLGRAAVRNAFAEAIGEVRSALREGSAASCDPGAIAERARRELEERIRPSLRRVLNATGVVVHTNLGRSRLAPSAVAAAGEAATCACNLEYDLGRGDRGHRNDHVEWLLRQTTGADAALAVNNNAAAVLLCLSALARGREVIVSRGEQVEIGGSFRIPDVLAYSGARQIEVGTTNRTRRSDYEAALTPDTAMILKVHPSNYRIVGFCESASREELAALARERDLILVEDLGSGLLVDPGVPELRGEPTVRECLEAGVDLVTFSGDKLLGGPQIGVVAGRSQLLDRLRRDPLLRAFRVDKMTLAAFEATLRLYLAGREGEIPALAALRVRPERLEERARRMAADLGPLLPGVEIRVLPCEDAVGGGAFPAVPLPGWCVALGAPGLSAGTLARRLREGEPPLLAGAEEDRIRVHLRSLFEEEDPLAEAALVAALRGDGGRD